MQSPHADLQEILPVAVNRLLDLEGILVEGNSAVGFLKPDIVVFLSGDEKEFKEGAENILRVADVVLYHKNPPEGIPERSQTFRWDDIQRCVEYVIGLVQKKKDSRIQGVKESSG